MPKFILVYGTDTPSDMSTIPKEEVIKEMQAWGDWLGKIGSDVVDDGDAFKFGGKVVDKSGTKDADNLLTGYSIIEAKDGDAALEHARKCPAIAQGGHVHVYETFGL